MPENSREEIIHVRCGEKLKKRVGIAAALSDQSMSEWVRDTLMDEADDTIRSSDALDISDDPATAVTSE